MCPEISIIVPAYNVERYINRAIDSILAQSFTDFEIIIINDCSTDKTYDAINLYRNNQHIRIICHEENLGLGPARNTGIEKSKGKFLFFVDSDDWIEPMALEKLYNIALKEGADVVACGARRVYEDGTTDVFYSKCIKTAGGVEALEMIPDFTIADVAWNKLYKKELLDKNHLRFPAIYHEDLNFAIEVVYHCNLYISIPDELYNYYQSNQSITRSKISGKHLYAYIERFKLFDMFVKQINYDTPIISKECCQRFYKSMSYNAKRTLLAFCEQTAPFERDIILQDIYSKQFGDGYYYVKNLLGSLIDYKKSFDITIAFLKVLNNSKAKKIVFFGSGTASATLYSYFPLDVAYFVDNNSQRWGNLFCNLQIYNPDKLLEENKNDLLIVIASQYSKSIASQLVTMGFQEEVHFFDGYAMFKVIF